MSFMKQSDVKNHLSHRTRSQIHLIEPVSQPDATGFSGVEPGPAGSIAVIPVEGLPVVTVSDSGNAVPSAISNSVQK